MPAKPTTDFFTTDRGRELLHRFEPKTAPAHVAVIMDGNGRWAASRGLPRAAGHKAGARAVEEAISTAIELGIRHLTLYSFSTENWSRPADEVRTLMTLFVQVLKAKMNDLMAEGVRVRVIGRLDDMPTATSRAFREAMLKTSENTVLDLVIALNYGGRAEIVDAVRAIGERVAAGELSPSDIAEDTVSAALYAPDLPDPDMVIRTSGEHRLSNFLLWQVAYSEFHITDVLWPDFDRDDLLAAVVDFQGRERRFGGR